MKIACILFLLKAIKDIWFPIYITSFSHYSLFIWALWIDIRWLLCWQITLNTCPSVEPLDTWAQLSGCPQAPGPALCSHTQPASASGTQRAHTASEALAWDAPAQEWQWEFQECQVTLSLLLWKSHKDIPMAFNRSLLSLLLWKQGPRNTLSKWPTLR